MSGLEELHQRALRGASEDGEIVHLVTRRGDAGVVALVDLQSAAVDDMVGLADLSVFTLQQLHAKAVSGTEAEVVDFIVVGFVGQAVGVVLVRWEA